MAPKGERKPISERGNVLPKGNNWRAAFKSLSRVVWGPTRITWEEAAADRDVIRTASSEEEIAQIAQRLKTESAAAAATAAAAAASSGLKPLEGGGSASVPVAVPLESRAAVPDAAEDGRAVVHPMAPAGEAVPPSKAAPGTACAPLRLAGKKRGRRAMSAPDVPVPLRLGPDGAAASAGFAGRPPHGDPRNAAPVTARVPLRRGPDGAGLAVALSLAGLNIQWPFSQLLLAGVKRKELRDYVLGYLNIAQANTEMWLVETSGRCANASKHAVVDGVDIGARPKKAQIVGTIEFSAETSYPDQAAFRADTPNHRAREGGAYDWKGPAAGPRYAWHVACVRPLVAPVPVGSTGMTGFGRPRSFEVLFAPQRSWRAAVLGDAAAGGAGAAAVASATGATENMAPEHDEVFFPPQAMR